MASKDYGDWTRNDEDAFDMFLGILDSFGFHNNKEIAAAVKKMILDGVTDFNQIEVGLQETDAWKKRFAGNEQRRQAGLNVLSVSEYLATENAYAAIFHQAGLPAGFYDDPADFAKFIGNDVSADELNSRVGIASDLMNRNDHDINAELRKRGMGQGDILAMWLDPERALPQLQRKYQSILIGAAADRATAHVSVNYANKLAGMGITEAQAEQGFGTVADIAPDLAKLADIYGEKYGKRDAMKEVFESNANAAAKRRRLTSAEQAAFSGSSGTGSSSLGRNTSGSY